MKYKIKIKIGNLLNRQNHMIYLKKFKIMKQFLRKIFKMIYIKIE
jgi:hypothetical protein